MKKEIVVLVLLFVVSWGSIAQKVQIIGFVKDSIGNPLGMANVIAYKKKDNAMVSYGITNDLGKYKVSVPANETYLLKVSFIGLVTEDRIVEITDQDVEADFEMVEDQNKLDEVEIVYEMPVVVKGDTLVYNTDSFTDGSEKKLGDVLKKLPGVEVNEAGEIEVDGKAVSKVMVEGKDFFDGNSKLATKNIPADALDKVEVLKNHEEVSQLRGLSNSQDQIAINVKLKEGKKNFWFGDVTAGAGVATTERYLIKPKLFYYSPKYSLNLLTDFNDIGELPFTFMDYFKFTGGFRNLKAGGNSLSLSSDDLGFALLPNNRANEINTKFGATNFNYSPSKNLDISGYGIFSGTKTNMMTTTRNVYIDTTDDPNDNTVEETSDINEQQNNLGLLKLSAIYKPNGNFRLDYDILGKLAKQEEESIFSSSRGEVSENISEMLNNTQGSIQQSINGYYTLGSKNVFSLNAQHFFQNRDPFYNAIRDQIPFRGIFTQINNPLDPNEDDFEPLQESGTYNINQDRRIRTNSLDATLDYYRILNKKSNLRFTFGSSYSNKNFDSSIFQILNSGNKNSFDQDKFKNKVKYKFVDTYGAVHYKFIKGIFTINPGVSLHNYRLKDQQLGTMVQQNEWRVLPDILVIAQFKKNESLRFDYLMTANYAGISNLAKGYVFSNYNFLFQGNRNLESSLYDNYSLNYTSFNMFNYTNVYAGVRYSISRNPIKSTSNITGINQVSTPVNSGLTDRVFRADGSFERSFGKIKGRVSSDFSWSKYHNIVNELPSESISLTQNYETRWSTNFKKGPNFVLGYGLRINEYDNNESRTTFYTNSPFARLNWSFAKGFLLKSSFTHNDYRNEGQVINTYSFWNASIFYQKPDSKWAYKLSGTNLLQTNSINRDSFNELFTSTSSYMVQPRYWVLSITYNL
ncbi:TonB-dependent receptor [Aquimarina sp. 2201CG1-2-11]|uniref:outer membrane beta-barrel protein n=1 Tax=Aquimarina discodermiae TaxID=3231043 RepID=UPI003461EA4D